MIKGAEKNGRIASGGTVIEVTSTNTGPAVAWIGAMKGYKVKLCYPEFWLARAKERDVRLMIVKAYGPEVMSSKEKELSDEVLKHCSSDAERSFTRWIADCKHAWDMERSEQNVFWADQMNNPDNPAGHMEMGKELIEQLDGRIDAWGVSIGSAGAFLGVAKVMMQADIRPWFFGVQPEDMPIVDMYKSGAISKLSNLLGLGKESWRERNSNIERMLGMGLPDEMLTVGEEDARNMANRLCREEGIFCGMSSGANVLAALKIAKRMKPNQNVVTAIVDRRDRYLGEAPEEHYVI
jgi:cysteine synthase A